MGREGLVAGQLDELVVVSQVQRFVQCVDGRAAAQQVCSVGGRGRQRLPVTRERLSGAGEDRRRVSHRRRGHAAPAADNGRAQTTRTKSLR